MAHVIKSMARPLFPASYGSVGEHDDESGDKSKDEEAETPPLDDAMDVDVVDGEKIVEEAASSVSVSATSDTARLAKLFFVVFLLVLALSLTHSLTHSSLTPHNTNQ